MEGSGPSISWSEHHPPTTPASIYDVITASPLLSSLPFFLWPNWLTAMWANCAWRGVREPSSFTCGSEPMAALPPLSLSFSLFGFNSGSFVCSHWTQSSLLKAQITPVINTRAVCTIKFATTHTHILRHRHTHSCRHTHTHTATLLEWSQWPTHTLTEWLSSVTLMWTPSVFILRFCCVPVDFEVVNVDSSMASEDDINNAIMAIRRNGVALKGKCFICAYVSQFVYETGSYEGLKNL